MTREKFIELLVSKGYTEKRAASIWDAKPSKVDFVDEDTVLKTIELMSILFRGEEKV